MSEKKPVWVDLDAHQMLKEYADLTKQSMVELASELVLNHLDELESDAPPAAAPAAAPEAPAPVAAPTPAPAPVAAAPAPAPIAFEPIVAPEPEPESAPTPARVEKPRRERREDDGTIKYFGGVWLV